MDGVTIPLNVDQKDTIQQVKNFARFGGIPLDLLQDLSFILADSATLEQAYRRVFPPVPQPCTVKNININYSQI